MPQTIASVEGYARKIHGVVAAADEVLLYRGHSHRRDFKLLPSVLREQRLADSEHTILRELVASHPTHFASDATTLEQLVRVQHYSLPTRLLDATWNPLVALYFAARDHQGVPGEVIVFRIKEDHVKFYDSDTVSCVANLAHLKPAEKAAIKSAPRDKDFNQHSAVDRLVQFIRMEKPYFRPAIVPTDLTTVLCVKPKRSNERILAQSGAFLLFGLRGDLDTNPAPGIVVERIQVNGRRKVDILKELDRMAINESTMFPEIEKAAQYIASKI